MIGLHNTMLKKVQMNKERSKNAHFGGRFFVEMARWHGARKQTDRIEKVTDRGTKVIDRAEKASE